MGVPRPLPYENASHGNCNKRGDFWASGAGTRGIGKAITTMASPVSTRGSDKGLLSGTGTGTGHVRGSSAQSTRNGNASGRGGGAGAMASGRAGSPILGGKDGGSGRGRLLNYQSQSLRQGNSPTSPFLPPASPAGKSGAGRRALNDGKGGGRQGDEEEVVEEEEEEEEGIRCAAAPPAFDELSRWKVSNGSVPKIVRMAGEVRDLFCERDAATKERKHKHVGALVCVSCSPTGSVLHAQTKYYNCLIFPLSRTNMQSSCTWYLEK